MIYVPTQVNDWKYIGSQKTLNTFRLDNNDFRSYSGRLFGFSHGTNTDGFRKIISSGKINSSFNIREEQKAAGINQTGGDRGHDGQYSVYFRFVEKRNVETDVDIPKAIVRSLGGVGGGSGCVLFVSLGKIVQRGACFSLTGGIDGIKGTNCFTDEKFERAKSLFKRRNADGSQYSAVDFGKSQFELGLRAAESSARGNEIGFFDSISLADVEIIMLRGNGIRTVRDYSRIKTYVKRGDTVQWNVFLRNDSQLNIQQSRNDLLAASGPRPRITVPNVRNTRAGRRI